LLIRHLEQINLWHSYRGVRNAFRTAGAAASLAHCQNFSAAGLSRAFSATMPTEFLYN